MALLSPPMVFAQADAVSIGPDGGTANGVWTSPHDPDVVFAAGRGQLFRSVDAGASWQAITPAPFDDYSRLSLFFASDAPHTLFLVTQNGAVLRSRDGGASWSSHYTDDARRVVAVDADRPNRMWAYVVDGIYSRSLVHTDDGGRSWRDAAPAAQEGTARVWVNPVDPDHAVASIACCGDVLTQVGLFVTTDAGRSWARLGISDMMIQDVVFDPADRQSFYVVTHDRLLRTSDHGRTWREIGPDTSWDERPVLTVAPGRPDALFLAVEHADRRGASHVFRSEDRGLSWTQAGTAPATEPLALAVSAFDAGELWMAAPPEGVLHSADGGRQWTPAHRGLALSEIYVMDVPAPDVILAGVSGEGLLRSDDGGRTWQTVIASSSRGGPHHTLTRDGAGTLFTDLLPSTHYRNDSSWNETGGLAISTDDGSTWTYRRGSHKGPQVFDVSSDGQTIYGEGRLGDVDDRIVAGIIKSHDGGRSWSTIDLGTAVNSIEQIRVDPDDPDVVYVLAWLRGEMDQDVLLRTVDGGVNWHVIAEDVGQAFFNEADTRTLYYSPSDPGYLQPGRSVFASHDRGDSWAALAPLPDSLGLHDLINHPEDASTLFASTASGLLLESDDGGRNWGELATLSVPWETVGAVASDSLMLYGSTRRAGVQRLGTGIDLKPLNHHRQQVTVDHAYPAPARSTVHVEYELGRADHVSVRIYDALGRLTMVVLDEQHQSAGPHHVTWNGHDAAGRRVASGVYFCEIEASGVGRVTSIVIVH